jgi:shikimate kinase
MGTGKSTIGKKLAERLGRRFIDTDILIEKETGMTISTIFTERGEAHFRMLERAAIVRVCKEQEVVVATGGGVLVDEENTRRLKESGTIICLTATPEVILSRVQLTDDRPLLHGDNPLEKIRSLLAARADAYAKADLTIDTSLCGVDEVVDTVCRQLQTTLTICCRL